MTRSLVLTYWELRRICRSRPSLAAVLVIPAAATALHASLPKGTAEAAIRCFFPVMAGALAWGLLYARSFSDRASGFAAGLESTPAAGAVTFGALFLTGLFIAGFQSGVFYVAAVIFRRG